MTLSTLIGAHRMAAYAVFSTALMGMVVLNAFWKHSNFYSVAVYLSRSSGSVMGLANFGVLLTLVIGRLCQQIFFGPLRPMEIERLYDRLWFFVTESLLAFTIFRDEFDAAFVAMFILLLFLKCFHWIVADRIDWMDQVPYPGPETLFHIRTYSLLVVLLLADLVMLALSLEIMVTQGVGWIILFTSEQAILLACVLNAWMKYYIAAYDIWRASRRGGENAPVWEDKSMYTFYVELFTDFLKLMTYLAFFAVVMTFYGLPLNVVRDVYITARSFISRVRDLIRYRSATKNMDQKYPNATQAELDVMTDKTCIICREEMSLPGAVQPDANAPNSDGATAQGPSSTDGPNETPKKLPCGHIFHFHCLRSWLERQQSCPTCRRSVLEAPPTPPNVPEVPAPAPPPAPGPEAPAPQAPAPTQSPDSSREARRVSQNAAIQREIAEIESRLGLGPQPRVFEGFHAGGVWQPWNYGPTSDPKPTPTPTMKTEDSKASGAASPETNSDKATDDSDVPEINGVEPKQPARDAAAEAALRRWGLSTTPKPSGSSKPSSTSRTRDATPASNTAVRETVTTTQQSRSAPQLIPLFDPSAISTQLSQRLPMPFSTPFAGFPFVTPPPINSLSSQPFSQASMLGLSSLTPIPLQHTLSDEEVARLDPETQESLESRLNVLTSVEGKLWKCIDELTKLRSAYPSVPLAPATEVNGRSNGKGKGREDSDVDSS